MTDSTSLKLLYRIAELETELRLVKEQLVQGRESTQYLLQLVSGSAASRCSRHVADSEPQLQVKTSNSARRRDSIVDHLSAALASKTPSERASSAQLVDFEMEKPLLDEGAEGMAPNTPSLVPDKQQDRKPRPDSIGYPLVSEDSTPPTSFPGGPSRNQTGFRIQQLNGASVFIPTPSSVGVSADTDFPIMLAPEPCLFLGHEHRSLAGKAFVWVEMTAEELTEVFIRYAREHPRHSAEEYRSYFEDVIRPAYEEREKNLQKTREALLASSVGSTWAEPQSKNQMQPGQSAEEEEALGEVDLEPTPDMMRAAEQRADDVQGAVGIDLPMVDTGAITPADTSLDERVPAAHDGASSIGGYVAPRLYNPGALEVAKSLQAEFQSGAPTRGRPRRRSRLELRSSRHRDPDEKTEVPADGLKIGGHTADACRPAHTTSTFITYPTQVKQLFATAAMDDHTARRTIIIRNIPTTTSLGALLDCIRGGSIFSAVYFPTAGFRSRPSITTNSALITFILASDAHSVVDNWNTNSDMTAMHLRVVSRPITAQVASDIQQYGLSRVLFIHDIKQTRNLDGCVAQLMRHGVQKPLKAEYKGDIPGLMLFHFASLAQAKAAWQAVHRDHRGLGGVTQGFFPDPCGQAPDADDAESEEEKAVEEKGGEEENGDEEDVRQAADNLLCAMDEEYEAGDC